MSRFFLEVAYKGTLYAGFQSQLNANTIQDEVQKALSIYFRSSFSLTGSSRTDAGVHALQNFFHFDFDFEIMPDWEKVIYNINALLPADIVAKRIFEVAVDAHCRFDAKSRNYEYRLYRQKDPFIADTSYFYPYQLDLDLLNQAAEVVKITTDFSSFSKRNTQVKTFNCTIFESKWGMDEQLIVYNVSANRFLRGMVKGLVGTMLKVGRKKISIGEFQKLVGSLDSSLADFSVPAHGLWLLQVNY